jgi:hypothetical protein
LADAMLAMWGPWTALAKKCAMVLGRAGVCNPGGRPAKGVGYNARALDTPGNQTT